MHSALGVPHVVRGIVSYLSCEFRNIPVFVPHPSPYIFTAEVLEALGFDTAVTHDMTNYVIASHSTMEMKGMEHPCL